MAEEAAFINSLKSPDAMATPPTTTTPTQAPPTQASSDNAQPALPKTIGGFVDEDEDDDDEKNVAEAEAEEEALHSNTMSASSEYDPNIDGGPPATTQQDLAPPSNTDPARPSSSRPQSSMAFSHPPPVSDATNQQDQKNSDPEPVQPQVTSDVPTSNGGLTDALPSSTSSSNTLTAGRASANPTPANAPPSVSRPDTANGIKVESTMTAAPAARLPSDRVGILEDRIREDPRGDTDAWLALIDEFKRRGKLSEVRKTYDEFLALFPNNVS